jgi:hypothetical protein
MQKYFFCAFCLFDNCLMFGMAGWLGPKLPINKVGAIGYD